MEIELMTTPGCHLCEQAENLVRQVDPHVSLRHVDIALDDVLMEKYGERIPVLRCGARELGWPFSLLDARAFLDDCRA